jgi:WD40 repeat protein
MDSLRSNGHDNDESFADWLASVADKICDRGLIDLDAELAQHPHWEERLRGLIPTIKLFAGNRVAQFREGEPPRRTDEPHSGTARTSAAADRPPGITQGHFEESRRDLTGTSASRSENDTGADAGSLGDFRAVRELGRGGMGVVYEAIQISLNRRVALKVLPSVHADDPRRLRRFQAEAQAAACLNHPHIVPVYLVGAESEVPYFVMQLIEGRTVAQIIGESGASPKDPRTIAECGRQAALALQYAHEQGVIHRDIKPSNLLIDRSGWLWVADFGLALRRGSNTATGTGILLGTLRYLSPEQALGERNVIDHRVDLYSLGATLYEWLSGRPAFDGDDRIDLLRRIVQDEPVRPRTANPAIPKDLETIVLKAMAKDPAERYASAGEMAGDLALFLADQPIRARPPALVSRASRWARRRWRAIALLGVMTAVLLIGLLGVVFWSNARLRTINRRLEAEINRADRNARDARDQAEMSERHALGAQLRLAAGALEASLPERAQEILRDIPLNAGRESPRSFVWRYLWRRSRRDVVLLVGPVPRLTGMALSPDGKILATTEETAGLQLWDAASGAWIRDVAAVSERPGSPVFSPDGTLVAADGKSQGGTGPDNFVIWEVDTGRPVARLPIDHGYSVRIGKFLPGGGFLGYGTGTKTDPPHRVRLWSPDGSSTRFRLIDQWDQELDIESALAGAEIVTRECPTVVQIRDPRTGKLIQRCETDGRRSDFSSCACSVDGEFFASLSGPPWTVNVRVRRSGKLLAAHVAPEQMSRLSFSPDGRFIVGAGVSGAVYLVERASGATRRIRPNNATRDTYAHFQFSPDNTRIAVSAHAPGSGIGSVAIWETATGRRLASFPGRPDPPGKPQFTRDGRSLLVSTRSGVRLWHLPTGDGSKNVDRQPAGHKDEAWSLAFSPDGRTLASGSDDTEPDSTIKLWDIATSRLNQAWHAGEGTVSALAYSPDGRFLVSGHLAARDNVKIWEAATGRPIKSLAGHTDRVRALAFAVDGRHLATASSDGTVRIWDATEWRERSVLAGHKDTVHAVAFSPDGETLASAGNEGDVRIWNLNAALSGSEQPLCVLHDRANLTALAFAPGGRSLAVANMLGSITIWDINRQTPVRLIHGDGDELRQLAYAPDGFAVAAAGISGSIRLWDPVTGQELLRLAGHRAQVNGLAFSPDGSILATCAHDGSVRLWHAEP